MQAREKIIIAILFVNVATTILYGDVISGFLKNIFSASIVG